MIKNLTSKKCVPCEGDVDPLSQDEARSYLETLNGWELENDNKQISKTFKQADFAESLRLVNTIGEIAESEGHHPDINLHNYNKVRVTLSTHAIGGLSENDFIVAAKIDEKIS